MLGSVNMFLLNEYDNDDVRTVCIGGTVQLPELCKVPAVRGRRLPQTGRLPGNRERHLVRNARLRLLHVGYGPSGTDIVQRLDTAGTAFFNENITNDR